MGNIDLNALTLRREIQLLDPGDGYIDLVDGNGISIASSRSQRVLKPVQNASSLVEAISRQTTVQGAFRNADTGAMEILAFFSLSRLSPMTKWGVAVWELEEQALIPARALETQFFIAGFILLALGMLFAWGMGRSIVRPIAMLTRATQRIAAGELSDPIPVTGADELGRLANSFDAMRRQLKASAERIQQWNRELEKTVHERTQELEQSQVMRGQLLRKLIFAQEEERKRIARELHDETSQALTALVVALDMALMTPASAEETKAKLASMKIVAVKLLDGVRQMIFDLRPSVLDDLGLVPALRWYADERLKPLGVRVNVETTGAEKRLPPEVEVALFRVVQEAVTNVGKHAESENVVLSIGFGESSVSVELEDDGKGFDPRRLVRIGEKGEGLGLLGMKERVFLLGGSMTVDSEPGAGTRVRIQVPLVKAMVKG
jgi:signal transduction histidine kinase